MLRNRLMPRTFHDNDEGGAGGGTTGTQGGQQDGSQDQGGKGNGVSLTQEELERLIDKKFAQGASQAEKKLQGQIKDLEAKLAKYEGKDPSEKKGDGKTFTQEDLQRLLAEKDEAHKGEITKAQETLSKLRDSQKRSALMAAAVKAKAIDPEAVAALVDASVQMDDEGNLVIVGKDGKPRINGKGDDLSVEEYVTEFLASKPYLKQGSGTTGAGSTTLNGTTTGGAKTPKTIAEANAALAELLAKGG